MPIVKLPDGRRVKIPDDMPLDEAERYLSEYTAQPGKQESPEYVPPQKSAGDATLAETPGAVGGLLGGVAKTAVGRTGLSALLAAGGEGFHQVYQHATGSPEAPQTSTEAIKRMGRMAGVEGVGNLVGEGIFKVAGKLIPRVKPEYLEPGMKEPEGMLRPFMEKYLPQGGLSPRQGGGPGFTVAQKASPHSGAAKFENIIEKSLFGSSPIKRLKYAQEHGIDDFANFLEDKVWTGADRLQPSEIGKRFTAAYDTADEAFRTEAKRLYSEVDSTIGGESVDLSNVKRLAEGYSKKAEQMAGIGSSESGDTLLSRVTALPDNMTFADAADLRSRLLKEEYALEGRDKAKGLASRMVQLVDTAMDKAATRLSPDARDAWRGANEFYKTGKETFDSAFISKLAKRAEAQPELVGKAIFQNGKVSQINGVKAVLKDSPETWQSMKASYLSDIISGARSADSGALSGKKLSTLLKNSGEESLRAIFTPKELHILRQFEKAAVATQKKEPGGGGSMLIQLLQAGPVAGLVAGGAYFQSPGAVASGIGLLFMPRVFAHMLVSPKYQKLFIQGMSSSKPVASTAISKLAASAVDVYARVYGNTEEANSMP